MGVLSNAVFALGKAVNFLGIWNQQSLSPAFERALGQASDAAHDVLMHPATGYRNISEWAKQQKCWEAIKLKKVDWDKEWLGELIGLDEEKDIQREGSRNQKTLNGIEAQTAVCEMGSGFWQTVLRAVSIVCKILVKPVGFFSKCLCDYRRYLLGK